MKFLVWGLGRSGSSAEKLLRKKGYEVFSGDDARGDRWEDFIGLVDTVVLSPGIPPYHPLWKEAQRRDIEIIGELELAYRFFKGDIIAITGTDGKSTTTRLTYLMLSSHLHNVREAGNIGTPLSEVVLEDEKGIAVVEVSSFQGKTLKTFAPKVGAFLNFHEDHLDWHPSIEDYLGSKHNIFLRQEEGIFIAGTTQKEVLNTPTGAKKLIPGRDFYADYGLVFRGKVIFRRSELRLRGEHNFMNAVVASLIALHMGVPIEKIREVIRSFRGLRFRMEPVGRFKGVEIYNDSKSTTPNSLRAGLESFPDRSVVLIAGGKDKGADFSVLRDSFERKVKLAILIGEARDRMRASLGNSVPVVTADSLEEAVDVALKSAEDGEFILFSPGCSSFDMFSSYVERGESFSKLIKERCKL